MREARIQQFVSDDSMLTQWQIAPHTRSGGTDSTRTLQKRPFLYGVCREEGHGYFMCPLRPLLHQMLSELQSLAAQ